MRPGVPAASAEPVLVTVLDERRETCTARPAFGASKSVGIDHAVNYGVNCNLIQPKPTGEPTNDLDSN